ncbi:MAG: helix-turn-helix transcriptional regulator [Clostridia bacterium]|nr:helix-turn-helix transcriptional regulator [Clostridia bacterium]
MYYNLGEKLKSLRKARDLTQEQLAERLGLSAQAVSKWETNASYPDISLLPVLANFYGVTTDELLGVDVTKAKEKIKAYADEVFALYHAWKYKEMVEAARKACAEYPGDDETLFNLAWALGQAHAVVGTKEETLGEAVKIAERILADSTDTAMRLKTTSLLSYLYHWNGNDEQALAYANQLPRFPQTGNYLIGRLGLKKGEEKTRFARQQIQLYYEAMAENVKILCGFHAVAPETEDGVSPESRIEMIRQLMQIQSLVFGDDLLFENRNAMQCCYTIAALYLLIDRTEEALDYLEKALVCADRFEGYDEKARYTSGLLRGTEADERSMYSQSAYKELLCEFKDKRLSGKYAKLNGHARYKELVKIVAEKAE